MSLSVHAQLWRAVFTAAALTVSTMAQTTTDDPHLWLEDVMAERALAWAREQNALSQRELEADPGFAALNQRILAILESDARIPYVVKRGTHYYNFWRDAAHVRGLWRRT